MKINFMSATDRSEKYLMYSVSDNVEIMIGYDIDKIIEVKGSSIVFDDVDGLF